MDNPQAITCQVSPWSISIPKEKADNELDNNKKQDESNKNHMVNGIVPPVPTCQIVAWENTKLVRRAVFS